MRQNWFIGIFSGIMGIWLILVVFLGFSSTLSKILLVITGFFLGIFGFWSASRSQPLWKNSESEIIPPFANGTNSNYSPVESSEKSASNP